MIRCHESQFPNTAKRIFALIALMMMLSVFLPGHVSHGEATAGSSGYDQTNEGEDAFPVITSVGRSNVKVNGVKSKGKLVKYTIPEQLLRDDPDFLALMVEAEKYIGYPFVYGAASPDTGFDCSGFVCWVFTHSGVCEIKRVGANGLYSMCTDVASEDLKPGDLVFFEKTMGSSVKGITHVGIYVGNHMMIHAGDPVGFADLRDPEWAKKIYGYGRMPIK